MKKANFSAETGGLKMRELGWNGKWGIGSQGNRKGVRCISGLRELFKFSAIVKKSHKERSIYTANASKFTYVKIRKYEQY